MTSSKFMTLDISWPYPCVRLTGSQFWRSGRKILVAEKGRGKIKKAAKTGDILMGARLERLRRIVSDDSWIPALFLHLLSDLSRQVSAGILRKKKLLKY